MLTIRCCLTPKSGTARKAAKLSVVNTEIENFDDLEDLLGTLPTKSKMTKHQPPIETDAQSERVEEEKRNARVRTFLYAASREDDNDFHLIVGRDPAASPKHYMTMEISGLPPENRKHFAQLKHARDAYKAFFGADLPGPSYDFYDPPIPVTIAASLFFDMSHAQGPGPGPSTLRPLNFTLSPRSSSNRKTMPENDSKKSRRSSSPPFASRSPKAAPWLPKKDHHFRKNVHLAKRETLSRADHSRDRRLRSRR